jgi:hypothetical protein
MGGNRLGKPDRKGAGNGVAEGLVAAGIRPPVMILLWSSAGKYFRAVHYPANEHEHYAKNLATYAPVRNQMLLEHSWASMDCVEYDVAKTAKTAAIALAVMRGAVQKNSTSDTLEERPTELAHTKQTKRDTGPPSVETGLTGLHPAPMEDGDNGRTTETISRVEPADDETHTGSSEVKAEDTPTVRFKDEQREVHGKDEQHTSRGAPDLTQRSVATDTIWSRIFPEAPTAVHP